MSLEHQWKLLSSVSIDANNYRSKLIPLLLKNRKIGNKEKRGFLSPPGPQGISILDLGVSKTQLEKSYQRVERAVKNEEQIIVFGDYDVDGLCSTAIVWEALYRWGAKVLPTVPNRLGNGYGLKPAKVLRLKEKFPKLGLIITVDNGVAAFEAVKKAKELGVDVIVIDHHLKPVGQPLGSFALIHSLKVSAGGLAWFWVKPWGEADLGLAALSTIADMMPLVGVNRSLVKHGLPVLEKTRRVGLRHLFSKAGIGNKPIDTYQVAFMIAPRLNALGRLADPMDGLRLICTKRIEQGADLAGLANRINIQRQQMVAKKVEKAERLVGDRPSPVIIVDDKDYHQGIVGLIAARLKKKYHRPSLAISREDGLCRGSARSIDGVDIVAFLKKTRGLMEELGGHPKAAGFSLQVKNLPALKKRIAVLAKKIDKKLLLPTKKIDCRVSLSALNLDFHDLMVSLSPFGEGNPSPVFAVYNARVVKVGTVGKDGSHLKLMIDSPKGAGRLIGPREAIGFGLGHWSEKLGFGDRIDLVFSPMADSWGGRRRLVLKVDDLKISGRVLK